MNSYSYYPIGSFDDYLDHKQITKEKPIKKNPLFLIFEPKFQCKLFFASKFFKVDNSFGSLSLAF